MIDSIRFNFLYVGDYTFSNVWKTPKNYVPYCMVRYITEGEAIFEIDHKKLHVTAGDIVYIPQGSLLFCESSCQAFSFISIRFTSFATVNNNDFLTEYYNVNRHYTNDTQQAKIYFDEILNYAAIETPYKQFVIRGNLELLIAFLIKNSATSDIEKEKPMVIDVEKNIRRHDSRIQLVIDYLVLHPTKKYSTEFLCNLADLSESSFRRLFKEQTGKTPTQFILELKLLTASKQLIESSLPINQIAYTTGFESSNYFIRCFKKNFGVTPSQYRDLVKK